MIVLVAVAVAAVIKSFGLPVLDYSVAFAFYSVIVNLCEFIPILFPYPI